MNDFLLTGMLAGLVFGLFHAVYMSRLVTTNSTSPNWITAFNFAFWTIALWLLMGAYLLGFWLIACAFYLVFKAFR
jgi:hypothetical protein